MTGNQDRKVKALTALVDVAAQARRYYPRGKLDDLEPAPLQVLLAVDLLERPGVGALAERLALTPQAVSGALRVLRELKLVRTRVSDEDRRRRVVELTAKGRARVDAFLTETPG